MSFSPIIFNLHEYMMLTYSQQYQTKLNGFHAAPTILGGFSMTSERIYRNDFHQYKYFVMPEVGSYPLNLNTINIAYNERDYYAEYLDNMQYFIKNNRNGLVMGPMVLADIITQENVLTTLLCTLYMKKDWRILGTRYHNTLYLCLAKPTSNEISEEEKAKERHRELMEAKLKHFIYSGKCNSITADSLT